MTKRSGPQRYIQKILLEMGFIIFLFYANLLMGQYNAGHTLSDRPISEALRNIFTIDNFIIAVVAAFVGHMAFDYLRTRL